MLPDVPVHMNDFPPNGAVPPLTEERFMDLFLLFSHATGVRLIEQDFNIEGQQVNPWTLHRAVFVRNGFDSVTANGEWPIVGAALGFPPSLPSSSRDPTGVQLSHCAPAVAHRLHQLYQDTLRHFDQAYASSILSNSSQTSGRVPPHLQQQPVSIPQPTEADYEALFSSVPSEASPMTSEAMRLLPRFSRTVGADLEAKGVPRHVIAFVEQNREHLQRMEQGQNGPFPENAQLGNITHLNQTSGIQAVDQPSSQTTQNSQKQQERSGGEPICGGLSALSLRRPQMILRALQKQVMQGVMTPQQAQERFAMMQTADPSAFPEQGVPQQLPPGFSGGPPAGNPQQQLAARSQPSLASVNNQMFQRVIQSQDPSLARQFNIPSHFVPPANVQSSLTPSTSQAPSPPGQQVFAPSTNFADLPLPQLRAVYAQMIHTWMEGDKNLQVSNTSGGEGDLQRRQQLRLKLDTYKQRIDALQEFINNKARASGDLSQVVNGPSWPGQAQMAGPPPQQSTQIVQPPSQQSIQPHKIPPLPEERFKGVFMQFTAATGLRLTDRDLVIEGRPVNPWALHRAVFMRNGFKSVSTNDEWPLIGVALGFPVFTGGDGGQPARCAPAVAHRLQQLYNAVLRQFDQAYISSIVARIRASSQIVSQAPQPQAQPHQPTEADYQALLASISSESPAITPEAMSILPRFSHAPGADLEAHRVPQHVIGFIEQNREQLQRAAQDQSGFRAGIPSTKNASLDHRAQVNEVSGLQTMAWFNPLQPGQLFNPPMRPPTAQSTNASNMSMGAQMATSSSGAQNQGGVMSVPMNPAGVNGIASGSVLPQPAGSMQMWTPTQDDVMNAKRWVEEQKKVAFSRDFDGVAGYPTIPESDIQEYHRNLERLDHVLSNIEKYIHVAFAALGKGDVVQRMFTMMVSARAQLEELKKPNPRYVLELHTIRGLITEAGCMDKGLKTVLAGLGIRSQGPMTPSSGTLSSAPQPPPGPLPVGNSPQFTRLTTLAGTQGDESVLEDLFDDEVRTAMDKLRI